MRSDRLQSWFPVLAALPLALSLLTASGCGPSSSSSSDGPAKTAEGSSLLRRGNGTEPQTLDPHKAQDVASSNILRDLFEGLVIETPDGSLIPGTADHWDVSPDKRTYTFHLRRDARWSNGDPVTADDFAYGLRRCVDPATGSSYAQILAPIENATDVIAGRKPVDALGVRVVDSQTLEIHLKGPTPYFVQLLTHTSTYPLHKASVQANGTQFTQPGKLISNGAYRLSEWTVFSRIRLQRNPHYWNNAHTAVDVVDYYPTENVDSELSRYRAGEIDMTEAVPISQIDWVRKSLGDEYHNFPYLGTYYYGLNLTKPPFKDNLSLRKALSLAIDRKALVTKVTRGGEFPAFSWVPPDVPDYQTQQLPYALWPDEQRIAEARRLYQEAGYSDTNPLHLEFRYNTSENHKKIATAIAAMWKQTLGVDVSMINEEWKVFLDHVNAKEITQVYRSGWTGDYNDANTFLELLHSRFGLNGTGYSNPHYDELLDRAAVEADTRKREQMLEEAERSLLADHAIIPIYYYVTRHLVKPWVRGYTGNLMDHHYSKDLSLSPAGATAQ